MEMPNARLMPFLPLTTLGIRAFLIACIGVYIWLFNWLYVNWLAPTFSYMGMTYHPPASSLFLLAWCLALVPGFWMPLNLRRPSQIPFWFVYLMLYVPSLFSPQYMALQSRADLSVMIWCFFLGFLIISAAYVVPPVRFRPPAMSSRFFWLTVIVLALLLDAWVLSVFHSGMRLVGFDKVYDLRWEASRTGAGTGVEYAVMLLSSVINPFFMAYGLAVRRRYLVFVGFLDQLFLYTTQGSKAVILSVFVMIGLYVMIKNAGRRFGLRLTAILTALLVVLAVLSQVKDLNPVVAFALSLLFMRSFANGGYMSGAYANFFYSHPLTHLSSVHGIDALVADPYHAPLGMVLGYYEMGTTELDLNAHFWASDGIAAFGPIGIIIISVLCAAVFWILDSSAARHDVVLASLMVAFVTLNLLNVSLFTTLVSGGLGLVILLLMLMPGAREVPPFEPAAM